MGSIPQISVLKGLGTDWTSAGVALHTLLEDSSAHPETNNLTAVIYTDDTGETRRWTLKDLNARANQLARVILAHTKNTSVNADGDSLVCVSMPPSDRLVVTLLAVWKSGSAYLPIDPCSPADRRAHILSEAKPRLLITHSGEDKDFNQVKTLSYSRLEEEAKQLSDHNLGGVAPSQVAIVLYTSGSTGVPKGVRIPQSAILNRLQWQWREFPYGVGEHVCVFKTALTFVDSVSEIWGPLLHPSPRTVLVVPRAITKDPQRLIALLDNYKIERLVLVPTLLRSILMYLSLSRDAKRLQRLRLWVCSGETLVVSLARQFVDYFDDGGHALCNFYGSTEIMGDVSYHVIRNSEDIDFDGKVPIGVAVDNTLLYLLDKQLRVVSMGETGELYVAGRNLALGYVNGRDPHRFIDNPNAVDPEYKTIYRTGDFAKIFKGTLVFEGRTDSQVKVRGHRVDLSEIEAAAARLKGIQKAVVLCYRPGEVDQVILAFVLPEDNFEVCDKDIETNLEASLPPYAIPKVIVVEKIPFLINGKVDRQYLLRSYEELNNKDNEDYDIDFTGIPTEKFLAAECLMKTVASVLGPTIRGKISAQANFYALGGNSLNSVFTVTKLRDQGYLISITDFITAKTLGEIIDKMVHEDSDSMKLHYTRAPKLKSETLKSIHKSDVYRIITDSFYEKADLERWIEPPLQRPDYAELMDALWEPLIAKGLSFVVKTEDNEVVGVSLNFDAHDEPEVQITSKLTIVFNFLEYLEGPIRDRRLPVGKGKVLHSFMMGTEKRLGPGENVQVIEFMENENLKLAHRKHFAGIFTTNTNPLTQQLGTDVYNYTVMHNYQVNQYVAADGSRPFKDAPDDQKAVCSWKPISDS